MQARPHALANAVAERFTAGGGKGGGTRRKLRSGGRCRLVGKISRDDGRAIVVVARVEDQADRVPNPLARLHGAEFVEREYLGFKNGAQHLKFGGLHGIVVAVLDLFEQVAIVAEKAGATPGSDQLLEDADGEMGLAGADTSDEQQTLAFARVEFLDKARGADMGERDGAIGAREIGGELRQLAMLVALGNVRGGDEGAGARPQLAIAARDAVFGRSGNGLPS